MQQIAAGVKQTLDAIYVELTAKPKPATAREIFWRFGTVWYVGILGLPANDRIKTTGA